MLSTSGLSSANSRDIRTKLSRSVRPESSRSTAPCRAMSASSLGAGIMSASSELETLVCREGLETIANGHAADRAFDQGTQQRFHLACIEIEHHRLDGPDRGRGERELPIAQSDERQRSDRFRRQLPAQGHRLAAGAALVRNGLAV